eukprot:6175129-Pleurochrysis_carterae.AAC.1
MRKSTSVHARVKATISMLRSAVRPHKVLEDVAVVQLEDQALKEGDEDRADQEDRNDTVEVKIMLPTMGAIEKEERCAAVVLQQPRHEFAPPLALRVVLLVEKLL